MSSNKRHISSQSVHDITLVLARNSLDSWFKKYRPRKTYNHFDIFFPKERHIHSVIQSGLTSFGTFWEKLSFELAKANGFKVMSKEEFNKDVPVIPKSLLTFRQKIRQQIESNRIDIKSGIEELRNFIITEQIKPGDRTKVEAGKGVDFWFKKDNFEFIGDIKSPQENIGNAKKLVEHILIWSSHRLLDCPNVNIDAVIAFPYNPFKNIEDYMSNQGKKLHPLVLGEDFLIADQFWDKVSGVSGSSTQIFNALKAMSASEEIMQARALFKPTETK